MRPIFIHRIREWDNENYKWLSVYWPGKGKFRSGPKVQTSDSSHFDKTEKTAWKLAHDTIPTIGSWNNFNVQSNCKIIVNIAQGPRKTPNCTAQLHISIVCQRHGLVTTDFTKFGAKLEELKRLNLRSSKFSIAGFKSRVRQSFNGNQGCSLTT